MNQPPLVQVMFYSAFPGCLKRKKKEPKLQFVFLRK